MNLSAYLKVDGNLYFRNSKTMDNFVDSIKSMNFAIFDFDGTLFPGLFIFDLTKKIFSKKQYSVTYRKKLVELEEIAQMYNSGYFETAYAKFVRLLNREDKSEFVRESRVLLAKSYIYGELTVKKLKEKYNLHSVLVSLTSNFIAELVREKFSFQATTSIDYEITPKSGKELFTGKFGKIESPQVTKQKMLSTVGGEKAITPFICFCDSSDDLPIFSNASIKVGINPSVELIKSANFDVILIGVKTDPWKSFYNFI